MLQRAFVNQRIVGEFIGGGSIAAVAVAHDDVFFHSNTVPGNPGIADNNLKKGSVPFIAINPDIFLAKAR